MLHESLFFLFQMVLVVLVFVALLQYVNTVASDVGFFKRYTSIDLGLLVTALHAAPGTIKHSYSSIQFPIPIEADFANSIVRVSEVGRPLVSEYWFLSDLNINVVAFRLRSGLLRQKEVTQLEKLVKGEQKEIHLIDATFYKSPGRMKPDEMKVNPLQLPCPSLNSTDLFWDRQKKVLIGKVFQDKAQLSDGTLPINRIAQILSAQSSAILVNVPTKASPQQASPQNPASGGLLAEKKGFVSEEESAEVIVAQQSEASQFIPSAEDFKQADSIILLGTTASADAAGALRVYIPASKENSMKSRKLACLTLNKLLTPGTEVSFVQIFPVFQQQIDKKSPLQGLFVMSDETKPTIFLDLGSFAPNEINVENTAYAIFNGIHQYYDSQKSIVLNAPPIVIGGTAAGVAGEPQGGIGPMILAGFTPAVGGAASQLRPGAEGIYTLAIVGGDPYIRAFMRAITVGEGTKAPTSTCPDPYRIVVGGGCFEGTGHPNQVVKLSESLSSSAAGRYQFLSSAWKTWAQQYGIPLDQFTAENQDMIVYKEIERLGVGQLLAQNNLDGALKKTNGIWASLPGSKYGQRTESRENFERFYTALLAEEKGEVGKAGPAAGSSGLIASAPSTASSTTAIG